jgi:glycerol kinase
VAEAARDVGVWRPAPDRVEQDPEELVGSVRAAVAAALDELGEHRTRVVAAGLATQRSSLVCWDRRGGMALSPVLSWQDRRAHTWLTQLAPHQGDIHRRTGLMVSAHYGASKFRWCLDNLPAVAAARKMGRLAVGPLASFLLFHLVETRPLLADPANAARTLLWNIDTGDWDPALCELFGVPPELLPTCVPTRHPFGALRVGDQEIPLTLVTGDQSAALFAFGAPRADTAFVNIGTGAFVQRTTGAGLMRHPRLLSSVVQRDAKQAVFALEGTVNGAGSALTWFAQEHGVADIEGKLTQWLAQTTEPPLFLNGIGGLGAPFWIADFRSRFEGEGDVSGRAVAVAESIVFLLQANLAAMAASLAPPARIVVTGGLARVDGICRRLAALSGVNVHRPVETEATAMGTGWLLAGESGEWADTGIGAIFAASRNDALRARYDRWRELMRVETGN